MKKQQWLSILLALCMALTLLPGTARAEDISGTCGDNLTWSLSDGTLTIQGAGDMENYSGSQPWGDYRGEIRTVNIGDGVTSIGEYAFSNCGNLTGVAIPDSVTSIGEFAFNECSSLTGVTIPNGVTSIPGWAFAFCYGLTHVTIPDSVTSIGKYAFDECTSLINVFYGGGEDQWKQITVDDANDPLTSAVIHYNNAGPTTTPSPYGPAEEPEVSYTCGDDLTWSLVDGTLTIQGTGSMDDYYSPGDGAILKSPWFGYEEQVHTISIGDGVTSIGAYAFYYLSAASVTIPDSVTSIGLGAFSRCYSLTDVYYTGSEGQWQQISIDMSEITSRYDSSKDGNEPLLKAVIHYNDAGPATTPALGPDPASTPEPEPAPITPAQAVDAVLSPQNLTVDGNNVECEKYNINGSNYFKLRDLAALLNGTGSQFEVGFDEATSTVTIITGAAYTPVGTELVTGADKSSTAQTSSQTILINGVERGDLTVYNIGGSNFFQLRELGAALGFDVDFDSASNTAIVRSTQS